MCVCEPHHFIDTHFYNVNDTNVQYQAATVGNGKMNEKKKKQKWNKNGL